MMKKQLMRPETKGAIWLVIFLFGYLFATFAILHLMTNDLKAAREKRQELAGTPPIDPRTIIKDIEENGFSEDVLKREGMHYQYVDYKDVSINMEHEPVVQNGKDRIKWTYTASGEVKQGAKHIGSFKDIKMAVSYTDVKQKGKNDEK